MIGWLIAFILLIAAPAYAAPSISVSPSSVVAGTAVTATWSGITSPVATDWIGTYTPSAANSAFQSNWVYVSPVSNCTQTATSAAASGSCSISTSSLSAGTYELRLLIADGFTSVATSSTFTVTTNAGNATRFARNNGLTTGQCTDSGTGTNGACTIERMLAVITCGETATVLNGTYQGASNMMDTFVFVPTNKTCSSGSQITIAAETDGGVFFDAQFARGPFTLYQLTYWNFTGFDSGNAGLDEAPLFALDLDHVSVKRHCASNNLNDGSPNNDKVFISAGNQNSLFEDICAFGWGRDAFHTTDLLGGDHNGNKFRRMWIMFEGYDPAAGSFIAEPAYYHGNPPTSGGDIYENIIWIYSGEQDTSSSTIGRTGVNKQGLSLADTKRGWIIYDYATAVAPRTGPLLNEKQNFDTGSGVSFTSNIVDIFVDGRGHAISPVNLLCSGNASCSTNSVDRVTSIRHPSAPDSNLGFANTTNAIECTTLTSCPNFYTGDSPSTGARNCFEYTDGVLGTAATQRLWPWRMDDRIKAARARAHTAGTGGTALSGSAGSGYAANTVTSEIVDRYGSVPTACLREASFTPAFPVASDFPSVVVRDDFNRADAGTLGSSWTELTADVFSIVSNQAVAPSGGVSRALYTDTAMQPSHEVYADWTSVQSCCGYMTVLSFAGTSAVSANSQYRYEVNRQSSGNTMVKVVKIDSGGSSTTIVPEVDLGIDIADPNSFGARVSGTTLSIYWKWTDGIWYRVGSGTDSTLATLPSSGVYGGISGQVRSVIGNFGAGPFVDQPEQDPPTPPASSGAGRFGTTFPGVR